MSSTKEPPLPTLTYTYILVSVLSKLAESLDITDPTWGERTEPTTSNYVSRNKMLESGMYYDNENS